MEDLIGFFANTIVFPRRPDGRSRQLPRSPPAGARRSVLAAVAYQDMPFDQLVNGAPANPRHQPDAALFQVMFALQNSPMPPLESPEMVDDTHRRHCR